MCCNSAGSDFVSFQDGFLTLAGSTKSFRTPHHTNSLRESSPKLHNTRGRLSTFVHLSSFALSGEIPPTCTATVATEMYGVRLPPLSHSFAFAFILVLTRALLLIEANGGYCRLIFCTRCCTTEVIVAESPRAPPRPVVESSSSPPSQASPSAPSAPPSSSASAPAPATLSCEELGWDKIVGPFACIHEQI